MAAGEVTFHRNGISETGREPAPVTHAVLTSDFRCSQRRRRQHKRRHPVWTSRHGGGAGWSVASRPGLGNTSAPSQTLVRRRGVQTLSTGNCYPLPSVTATVGQDARCKVAECPNKSHGVFLQAGTFHDESIVADHSPRFKRFCFILTSLLWKTFS